MKAKAEVEAAVEEFVSQETKKDLIRIESFLPTRTANVTKTTKKLLV